MPRGPAAVQHHAGDDLISFRRSRFSFLSSRGSSLYFQKKPGGALGEMETVTVLKQQPLIDLELSTPARYS
jgi:hypothetical protein